MMMMMMTKQRPGVSSNEVRQILLSHYIIDLRKGGFRYP